MTWDGFIRVFGPLGSPLVAFLGFAFVIIQLRIALAGLRAANKQNTINQDWKRAEFVAAEIKEFYKDPIVLTIFQMVDYYDRRDVCIRDTDGKPLLTRTVHSAARADELNYELKLKNELNDNSAVLSIEGALGTGRRYTHKEAIIRDYFDAFLYYIERFERFLKLRLISEDEIFPYMRYYIRIFRGKLKHVDPNMLECFRAYLRDFHFDDAENFFYNRFDSLLAKTD